MQSWAGRCGYLECGILETGDSSGRGFLGPAHIILIYFSVESLWSLSQLTWGGFFLSISTIISGYFIEFCSIIWLIEMSDKHN